MTIAESALTQAAHPDENPSTEADDSVLDGERVDSLPRSPGRHRPPTSKNSTSLTGKLVALLAAAALIGIGTAAAAATHSSGCDNCAAGIRLQGTFFGAFEQDAANGSGPQLYRITTARSRIVSGEVRQSSSDSPIAAADAPVWASFINQSDRHSSSDQAAVAIRIARDIGKDDSGWRAANDTLRSRSDALWSEAERLAGPYTTVAQHNDDNTVTVRVRAASSAGVAGAPVQLTWTNAIGPTEVSTLADGNALIVYTAGTGSVGVRATTTQLPAATLQAYRRTSDTLPNAVSIGEPSVTTATTAAWKFGVPSEVKIIKREVGTAKAYPGATYLFSDRLGGKPFATVTTAATPISVPDLAGRMGTTVYYREVPSANSALYPAKPGSFFVGNDGSLVNLDIKTALCPPP